MLDWIKRLIGATPAPPAPTDELAQVDAANIELGKQIDEIRAQRKALCARAAELRAQRSN
jgi:hypothetical protein